jgi:uncharacterized protein (TIGR00255 family)
MPLKSMTGFGRAAGQDGDAAWSWEIRTLNHRGLDIRLRLPQGYEEFELRLRDIIAKRIARGSCSITLNLKAPALSADLRLNEPALLQLAKIAERARVLTKRTEQPSLDALLAMRGVIELGDTPAGEADLPLREALLKSFETALDAVIAARRAEGARLEAILRDKIGEIETLAGEAETAPERKPEAIAERLRVQIQRLLAESAQLDETRLYQEAAFMAAKADIEEEIKRLQAHVAEARQLLEGGEPAGRKLEFLAQEFQREANTLCSKSNATAITQIGLRLKTAIDQFREQVQNVE